MIVLGIDPGAHGAIAFLDIDRGDLLSVRDMPSVIVKVGAAKRTRVAVSSLVALLGAYPVVHAYVEKVAAMPGQGVSSCFSFGYSAGIIEGILSALEIPLTFVTPQSWKKHCQVRSDKDGCRQRAMQLWPSHSDDFKRVKDDGRAEAAMIAFYGARDAIGRQEART